MIENQTGTYTFITSSTRLLSSFLDFGVPAYKRSKRLPVVNHIAWHRGSEFFKAKSSEIVPVVPARLILIKYI